MRTRTWLIILAVMALATLSSGCGVGSPEPQSTDSPMLVPNDSPVPTDISRPSPIDTPTPLPTDTPEPTDTPIPMPTDTPERGGLPSRHPLVLEMEQRPALTDSPRLTWSSEQIAAVLGTSGPQQGYWDPGLIWLDVLMSDDEFDPRQYDGPLSYEGVDYALQLHGDTIYGVGMSGPGPQMTMNYAVGESQMLHRLGINVQIGPVVELGIAPLPGNTDTTVIHTDTVLTGLQLTRTTVISPGFYAVRLCSSRGPDVRSDWVFFKVVAP